MQSRMDKYYGNRVNEESNDEVRDFDELEKTTTLSRADRNRRLYEEVSNQELEDFDINSNASVIGHGNEINIDSIREMLDKKYRDLPRNKSMGSMNEPEIGKVNLNETREFDINSVLEKAHKEKEVNYEEDRLKKLRNTQYDILKNLDSYKKQEEQKEEEQEEIEEAKKAKLAKTEEETKLRELIDTITAKELISDEDAQDLDPLDMFSDLRGDDDNTKVMGALVEEEEEEVEADTLERTLVDEELLKVSNTQGIDVEDTDEKELELKPVEISDEDIETRVNKILKGEEEEDEEVTEEKKDLISKDTDTLSFTESDFDDFDDLKDDMKVSRVVLRVLIFVIIVAFVIGCIVLANKLFGLGLF